LLTGYLNRPNGAKFTLVKASSDASAERGGEQPDLPAFPLPSDENDDDEDDDDDDGDDNEIPSGGAFRIHTTTANGRLATLFSSAPVDSKLHLVASTYNAPASVTLHPTYEGSLSASTSISPIAISINEGVTDPSGEGRKRIFELKKEGGRWGGAT
jgi:hypothetical protein